MVTLASKFEIPAGKTYFISKENDGTISLIPKIDDYFLAAKLQGIVFPISGRDPHDSSLIADRFT